MLSSLILHAADGGPHIEPYMAVLLAALMAFAVVMVAVPLPDTAAGFRVRARLPRPTLLWPIVGAWALVLAADAIGKGEAFDHDSLIEGGLAPWAAFILFLLAWQVMMAAMMLPSSLPLIRLFNQAASDQPRANLVRAAFLGGYLAIWSLFGVAAFGFDFGVHAGVDSWGWLADHEFLLAGVVFVGAGVFQFTDLKQRCLTECQHPAAFLLKHYRRGAGEGFRIGREHGLFCLGCCWALMLVAFAVGMANLLWMVVLGLVMLVEKTGKNGQRAVAPIGIGFIVLGVLVLAQAPFLPAALGAA